MNCLSLLSFCDVSSTAKAIRHVAYILHSEVRKCPVRFFPDIPETEDSVRKHEEDILNRQKRKAAIGQEPRRGGRFRSRLLTAGSPSAKLGVRRKSRNAFVRALSKDRALFFCFKYPSWHCCCTWRFFFFFCFCFRRGMECIAVSPEFPCVVPLRMFVIFCLRSS